MQEGREGTRAARPGAADAPMGESPEDRRAPAANDEYLPYHCAHCDRFFAEAALVPIKPEGPYPATLCCPRCRRAVEYFASKVHRPFLHALADAWRYPFRGQGWIHYAGMVVIFRLLLYAKLFGFGVLVAGGSFLAYLFLVVLRSSEGDDDMPQAAEFGEIFDLIRPGLKIVVVLLGAFAGPLLLLYGYDVYGDHDELSPNATAVAWVLAFAGFLLTPAMLLVASHETRWLPLLNPMTALRIVLRLPGAYLMVLVALTTDVIAHLVLSGAASISANAISAMPVFPEAIVVAVSLYAPLVAARQLGLLVGEHRLELGMDD